MGGKWRRREALFNISRDLESSSVDVDRVLLASKWLLRDVILVEEFLPSCDGQDIVAAVNEVVSSVQSVSLVLRKIGIMSINFLQ